jgi:flagellar L-ring protein precursor FlgH
MQPVILVAALALAVLAGCASSPTPAEGLPAVPQIAPVQPTAGAIYAPGRGLALFNDRRAGQVGDVITVILSEQTNAQKQASASTGKSTGIDIGAPSLFGGAVTANGLEFLGASVDANRDFSGTGNASQSNSLSGSLSVVVTEQLPNGLLVIIGEKRLRLNQGDEILKISGLVRPEDIQPDNTIASTRVANASISYSGRGALADANAKGWLARFFDSAWWPL